MLFLKHLVGRTVLISLTTVTALVLYVTTAVAFPSLLRFMQTGMDKLLGKVELWLEIPPQFMVWAEMADVNSKLVFIAFYIFTFIDLTIGWMIIKHHFKRLRSKFRGRKNPKTV